MGKFGKMSQDVYAGHCRHILHLAMRMDKRRMPIYSGFSGVIVDVTLLIDHFRHNLFEVIAYALRIERSGHPQQLALFTLTL